MKTRLAVAVLIATAMFVPSATADETTACNAFITSLPYTINVQGHYCFNRNLSTAITTGNAITINADYVWLDLNNFKLGGGSAGLGTATNGIYAEDRRNITIRNGNIRGFRYAVRLEGGGNHIVENNVLDGNTYIALRATGDLVVARHNIVSNTGGTTNPQSGYWAYGIMLEEDGTSPVTSAHDNTVQNVFCAPLSTTCGSSAGIWGATQAADNLIRMGDPGPSGYSYGIYMTYICRNNTVLDATDAVGECEYLVGDNFY
jgi:hypothetical protein